MDLIEKIGPFVGLAAFVGLAVLAFVIFQQSRDLRRLREWAGRAPERAKEAADASLAAAEARGEASGEERPGRFATTWAAFTGWVGRSYDALDRRLPFDPRILLGVLAAGVVAAAVLTSGFGLVGDGDGDSEARKARQEKKMPKVAVLNATQTPDGVAGVPGLADKVAAEVVRPAGYPLGQTDNAPTGFAESVIMYEPASEGEAAELARAVEKRLGSTQTEEMAADIRNQIGDSTLALLVGADDSGF
jgi:LytR cell envelope-related transcriptional attenuator